jgi:hypothetical protein
LGVVPRIYCAVSTNIDGCSSFPLIFSIGLSPE